eukprot:TRINITY_DN9741_c0_g1_i1.p1 TRINITY_DN9741_c0_g1~~TRINITY_DN9741_c0_g1_i1.p1  ORF type:complete len:1698 (+),score=515.37 TRINITY_DN9741_c0_g1_i1:126-5219(+)
MNALHLTGKKDPVANAAKQERKDRASQLWGKLQTHVRRDSAGGGGSGEEEAVPQEEANSLVTLATVVLPTLSAGMDRLGLPHGQVETHLVRVLEMQGDSTKAFTQLLLSPATVQLAEVMFWYVLIAHFRTPQQGGALGVAGWRDYRVMLFDQMASWYALVFQKIKAQHRSVLLGDYATCLAQALLSSFQNSFPYNTEEFGAGFTLSLITNLHFWFTGTALSDPARTLKMWDTKEKATTAGSSRMKEKPKVRLTKREVTEKNWRAVFEAKHGLGRDPREHSAAAEEERRQAKAHAGHKTTEAIAKDLYFISGCKGADAAVTRWEVPHADAASADSVSATTDVDGESDAAAGAKMYDTYQKWMGKAPKSRFVLDAASPLIAHFLKHAVRFGSQFVAGQRGGSVYNGNAAEHGDQSLHESVYTKYHESQFIVGSISDTERAAVTARIKNQNGALSSSTVRTLEPPPTRNALDLLGSAPLGPKKRQASIAPSDTDTPRTQRKGIKPKVGAALGRQFRSTRMSLRTASTLFDLAGSPRSAGSPLSLASPRSSCFASPRSRNSSGTNLRRRSTVTTEQILAACAVSDGDRGIRRQKAEEKKALERVMDGLGGAAINTSSHGAPENTPFSKVKSASEAGTWGLPLSIPDPPVVSEGDDDDEGVDGSPADPTVSPIPDVTSPASAGSPTVTFVETAHGGDTVGDTFHTALPEPGPIEKVDSPRGGVLTPTHPHEGPSFDAAPPAAKPLVPKIAVKDDALTPPAASTMQTTTAAASCTLGASQKGWGIEGKALKDSQRKAFEPTFYASSETDVDPARCWVPYSEQYMHLDNEARVAFQAKHAEATRAEQKSLLNPAPIDPKVTPEKSSPQPTSTLSSFLFGAGDTSASRAASASRRSVVRGPSNPFPRSLLTKTVPPTRPPRMKTTITWENNVVGSSALTNAVETAKACMKRSRRTLKEMRRAREKVDQANVNQEELNKSLILLTAENERVLARMSREDADAEEKLIQRILALVDEARHAANSPHPIEAVIAMHNALTMIAHNLAAVGLKDRALLVKYSNQRTVELRQRVKQCMRMYEMNADVSAYLKHVEEDMRSAVPWSVRQRTQRRRQMRTRGDDEQLMMSEVKDACLRKLDKKKSDTDKDDHDIFIPPPVLTFTKKDVSPTPSEPPASPAASVAPADRRETAAEKPGEEEQHPPLCIDAAACESPDGTTAEPTPQVEDPRALGLGDSTGDHRRRSRARSQSLLAVARESKAEKARELEERAALEYYLKDKKQKDIMTEQTDDTTATSPAQVLLSPSSAVPTDGDVVSPLWQRAQRGLLLGRPKFGDLLAKLLHVQEEDRASPDKEQVNDVLDMLHKQPQVLQPEAVQAGRLDAPTHVLKASAPRAAPKPKVALTPSKTASQVKGSSDRPFPADTRSASPVVRGARPSTAGAKRGPSPAPVPRARPGTAMSRKPPPPAARARPQTPSPAPVKRAVTQAVGTAANPGDVAPSRRRELLATAVRRSERERYAAAHGADGASPDGMSSPGLDGDDEHGWTCTTPSPAPALAPEVSRHASTASATAVQSPAGRKDMGAAPRMSQSVTTTDKFLKSAQLRKWRKTYDTRGEPGEASDVDTAGKRALFDNLVAVMDRNAKRKQGSAAAANDGAPTRVDFEGLSAIDGYVIWSDTSIPVGCSGEELIQRVHKSKRQRKERRENGWAGAAP